MGILASILGGGDVIKAGFDLIDDMHTSEVEAIEAKTKAKTDLLTAYAPFKVAQRLLAVMFSVTFLSCFIMVLLFTMGEYTEVDDVRKVMGEFYIAPIMFAIVGFYFGGGMLEGAFKAKNAKT
jgi:hypothetical protein